MGKAVKCELIFHGSYKEINMGEFDSKAKARQYVREVSNIWKRPFTIRPI